MTQAYELAMVIRSTPDTQIIAIGRFVPPAELTDNLPWKISIQYRGKLVLIGSGVEWNAVRHGRKADDPTPAKTVVEEDS